MLLSLPCDTDVWMLSSGCVLSVVPLSVYFFIMMLCAVLPLCMIIVDLGQGYVVHLSAVLVAGMFVYRAPPSNSFLGLLYILLAVPLFVVFVCIHVCYNGMCCMSLGKGLTIFHCK
jgi:hypothetical protein